MELFWAAVAQSTTRVLSLPTTHWFAVNVEKAMLASFFSSLSPHPDENNIFIFVRMRGEAGNKACSHDSEGWLLQGVFFSGLQVEGLDLSPVLSAEEAPVVVHGTYRRSWEQIRAQVWTEIYFPVILSFTSQVYWLYTIILSFTSLVYWLYTIKVTSQSVHIYYEAGGGIQVEDLGGGI